MTTKQAQICPGSGGQMTVILNLEDMAVSVHSFKTVCGMYTTIHLACDSQEESRELIAYLRDTANRAEIHLHHQEAMDATMIGAIQ